MEIQSVSMIGMSGTGGLELGEVESKGCDLLAARAVALHHDKLDTSAPRGASAPNLDPPVDASMSNKAASELNSLSESGNVMFDLGQLMKVMHQFALTQYEFSKEARHAERDMVQTSYDGQADKIREQASKERISGWVSAGFTMASGAVQTGAGAYGAYKASTAGDTMINPNKANINTTLQNYNNIADGVGQGLGSVGQFVAAEFDYQAKQAEADGKMFEADQKLHESAAEDENARVGYYRDMLNDCKEKLEKILTGAIQSSKNVTAKA